MLFKLILLCVLQAAVAQPRGPPNKNPPDAAERILNGPGRKYHMHDMLRPVYLPNNTVNFRVGKDLHSLNSMLRQCNIDLDLLEDRCLVTSKLQKCMEENSNDFEENFILLNMIMLNEETHKCSLSGAWKFLEDYPMVKEELPENYQELNTCDKLKTLRHKWQDLPFGYQQMSDIMVAIINWLDSVNTCLASDWIKANDILSECVQRRDESFRIDYLCIRIHYTLDCVGEIPDDNRAKRDVHNQLKRSEELNNCGRFMWDFYRFIRKKSKNATASFYAEIEANGTSWIFSGDEKHGVGEDEPRPGHRKEEKKEEEEGEQGDDSPFKRVIDLADIWGNGDDKDDEEEQTDYNNDVNGLYDDMFGETVSSDVGTGKGNGTDNVIEDNDTSLDLFADSGTSTKDGKKEEDTPKKKSGKEGANKNRTKTPESKDKKKEEDSDDSPGEETTKLPGGKDSENN